MYFGIILKYVLKLHSLEAKMLFSQKLQKFPSAEETTEMLQGLEPGELGRRRAQRDLRVLSRA